MVPDKKIKTAFDQIFPGLLDRVEAMGGDFINDIVRPVSTFTPLRAMRFQSFHVSFAFKFTGDNSLLRMEIRAKELGESYDITKFSYHYGPDTMDTSDKHFRIDYSYKTDPLHIHIRNYKEHIEPQQCSLDIKTIDADKFLEIVKEFRNTGIPPFRGFWIKKNAIGDYEIYQIGVTHSTRVATIGRNLKDAWERAKTECERRALLAKETAL